MEVSKIAPSSAASSIKSGKNTPITPTAPQNTSSTALSKVEKSALKSGKLVRVSYLTEQTSHHPPVSAFVVACPEKGLTARGFDQLSAKFTGTSIKVTPGEHNLGIFINLEKRDNEQYQLTHPAAHLGGLLRGALSVTVGDICYVTCPKTRIKTILHYLEEGWLGKTQNKVDGVVFRYDPENDNKTKVRDVPDKDILARISGNWKERLYLSIGPKSVGCSNFSMYDESNRSQETQIPLIDLSPLVVAPKILPPVERQLPNESLRFWSGVTEAINTKQFSRATTLKQEIEERQREKAKAREEMGLKWKPRFFTGSVTPLGKPELTDEGKEVLQSLGEGRWDLKESDVTAA